MDVLEGIHTHFNSIFLNYSILSNKIHFKKNCQIYLLSNTQLSGFTCPILLFMDLKDMWFNLNRNGATCHT